jgi:uncharacterized protein
MKLSYKAFDSQVDVKEDAQGVVECVVSCFGNKDSDNDIVEKGAFAKTLDRWAQKGKLPPGVWHHDWKAPVAKTLKAYEAEDGLHVKAQFNLETQRGRETFSDIKAGIVTEYSFGFRVLDAERKEGTRYIKEVEWFEWSPVLIGANRDTYTVGVKEAEAKGEYLGPYIEAEMTMAAMSRLNDAVWYRVYECLSDQQTSTEERLERVRATFGEYSEVALTLIEAILAGSARESADDAGKAIKTLWRKPDQKTGVLPVGMPIEDFSNAVLATVEDAKERYASIQALREKDGRTLSTATRGRIQTLSERLDEVQTELRQLLEETEPKAAEAEVLKARAAFLYNEARLTGALN